MPFGRKKTTTRQIISSIAKEEATRGRSLKIPKVAKKPSLLSKIAARFGRGPKVVKIKPKLGEFGGGHFGVHATSWKMRRERVKAGLPAFTAEEQAEFETFGPDMVQDFLFLGLVLQVHSSNVQSIKYDLDNQRLFIWYKGRGNPGYEYRNVSRTEALGFATALSKGAEVWNTLRIRGTKLGHRKPYRKIS